MDDRFRYLNRWAEVIRLVVMMYVKYPLSLRNVEDLLAERGIDISHETVRFWWNRFGPMFAAEIRKKRVAHMRRYPQWRWHLDEAFVKVRGKLCYLWRAVDHEGEVLESVVTTKRNGARARWRGGAPSRPNGRLGLGVLRNAQTTCRYSDKALTKTPAHEASHILTPSTGAGRSRELPLTRRASSLAGYPHANPGRGSSFNRVALRLSASLPALASWTSC